MNAELRHIEQQLLMARPWDAAEENSLWEISGDFPGGKGRFIRCLAVVLPREVHDSEEPLFVFVGALARIHKAVDPTWISHAKPLMLVHRDDPTVEYEL